MLPPLPVLALPSGPEITPVSILTGNSGFTGAIAGKLARPQPFRLRQASSYDRRSKTPGTPDWFANDDWGQYVREESNGGRREWVMADLRGPGALVHQWSANPVGTWRYYFDGETTPRLTSTGAEIAAGRWLGFREPYAYVASRGCNLYFPLTYARSLKVTVDASAGDPARMYYLLGHRDYPVGTAVRTFVEGDRPSETPEVRFYSGPELFPFEEPLARRRTIRPGAAYDLWTSSRPGTVTALALRATPFPGAAGTASAAALGGLVLEGTFDGEACLSAPVAHLFGAPPDARPYTTGVSRIAEDGTMSLSLPMPYHRSARLRLRNLGRTPITVDATAGIIGEDAPGALLLHAQFRAHPGGSRPFRDMPVAHLKGRGHYVGTVLHVANPSRAWWGEGDEKVRVDGEAFPAIFGTGTEDYFGYAWSSNEPFSRPYHAQPRADPDANSGQIANVRWHVLDPISYTRSLDFDLEQWHWANVESRFATTAFWYAAPGGTPATGLRARDLVVADGAPPRPEPGALQGEALEILARTGGATEVQSGFADLPDAQLWWRDAGVGDRLTLRLPELPAGRYRVEGRFAFARDYGRHALALDGQSLGTRDFYAPELGWRKVLLGTVTLRGGRPTLTIAAQPPNRRAEPRGMFGLDWIRLVRVR